MPRETATERMQRESAMIERAVQRGREQALAEVRALLGVPDEDRVRELITEAIDQHERWKHDHA